MLSCHNYTPKNIGVEDKPELINSSLINTKVVSDDQNHRDTEKKILSVDTALFNDLKGAIVQHGDIPLKNKWLNINKEWNRIASDDIQWQIFGVKFNKEMSAKNQVQHYIVSLKNHFRTIILPENMFSSSVNEEIEHLLHSARIEDIQTLEEISNMREILLFWVPLYCEIEGITVTETNFKDFSSINKLLEAETRNKFRDWCETNKLKLAEKRLFNFENIKRDRMLFSLPSELYEFLPNLIALVLKGNQQSELSTDVTRLTDLKILNLCDNPLKNLPESILQLPNLQYLNLGNTGLSLLPNLISKLTHLKILNLSKNPLKAFPECLLQLSNLNHLNLSDSHLTLIPDNISKLNNLKHFDLSKNPLKSFPESLLLMANLQYLNLSETGLNLLPDNILKLNNLQHLDLTNNAETIFVSNEFWQSPLANVTLGMQMPLRIRIQKNLAPIVAVLSVGIFLSLSRQFL